jgi:hypothetical protein
MEIRKKNNTSLKINLIVPVLILVFNLYFAGYAKNAIAENTYLNNVYAPAPFGFVINDFLFTAKDEFVEKFRADQILQETGKMDQSANNNWWLNSGASFAFKDGSGASLKGNLPANDPWRLKYFKNNPSDTDNGYHPQNILRLVGRSKWKNLEQQAYFKISEYNLSESASRQASNGLFLFNRYLDGNNIYYTGLRVDGFAVIKKKIGGKYYTMACNQVYGGKYDRINDPILLPKNQWIGLKSVVRDLSGGKVNIQVFLDDGRSGNWRKVADIVDDGESYGGASLLKSGFGGIRTDFMDVELYDYGVREIK